MNYQRHYNKLIERARNRQLVGYVEKHHIIPRCMGGTDEKSNLVNLTPEEHYIAHMLLVNIFPGDKALIGSAIMMTGENNKSLHRKNKCYGWLRREHARALSKWSRGRTPSAETRQKMSEAKKGKKLGPHSEETKAKMSVASKGRPKSKDHKEQLSLAKMGVKNHPHSEETKNKIRIANIRTRNGDNWNKSFFSDPIYKEKQSDKMKEIWKLRKSA